MYIFNIYEIYEIHPYLEYGGNLDTLKTRIIVDYKGNVYWFAPVLLKAQCSINVARFPFDMQECSFKFGSATFDTRQVKLIINSVHFDGPVTIRT